MAQTCCADGYSILHTIAGTGLSGYSGDGGPATSATFNQIFGITLDPAGDLYVCDLGNSVVRKISAAGIVTTYAGTGVTGNTGDGGPATLAQLNEPSHAVLDAAGNLYVTDINNYNVRKITPGGIISTFAGTGVFGYSGDGGPANLAKLGGPFGIALDPFGNILIADTFNHVIRKVNPAGIISTIAGTGTLGYSGDGGPASSAQLYFPEAVAVSPSTGNIYFNDDFNFRVRMINTCGIITTIAGTGVEGSTGSGGPATLAEVDDVHGFAFCGTNVYLADLTSGIRMIDVCGIIHQITGGGSSLGDGGPATLGTVNQPVGLAMDGSGNLYVGEQGGYRVRKVGSDCSPSPTPACNTPTPACTIPPTPTSTPTLTPFFTPTITPTGTPTQPACDSFFISKNLFTPAQESVSIHVEYCYYPGNLSLRIYNSVGEHIKTLEDRQLSGPYSGSYAWDGTNKYGAPCASGVYIFYLIEPYSRKMSRVLLVR